MTIRAAVLAVVALAAAACGGGGSGGAAAEQAAPPPQPGGTMVVGTAQAWKLIDPLRSFGDSELTISSVIYDRLLVTTPTGEVRPALAESYDVAPDLATYTLHLREGVLFHDGTPFDANAVKVNLERLADPENGCYCVASFSGITAIDTPDPRTVVIRLAEPDTAFLTGALGGYHTSVVSPAAIAEHGDTVGQYPVGTGPFRFVRQTPGAELVVEKWDRYWQPDRPYLDGITFQAMTDAESRFAALRSGTIQVAEALQPLQAQQAGSDRSVEVTTVKGYGSTFVQFNMTIPPFDNVDARRAVCAAIDRGAINQALNYGLNETAVDSLYPPTHPFYPGPDLPGAVAFAPDEAKRLVTGLGGLRFTLSSSSAGARVAEALQAQWRDAGMDAQLNMLEITALARQSNEKTYNAMYITMFGRVDPNDVVAGLYSSGKAGNVTGLADPEVDRLIAEGRAEPDPELRQDTYRKLSARLAQLTPVCYLWATDYHIGTAPDVHGVEQRPDAFLMLAGAYRAGD